MTLPQPLQMCCSWIYRTFLNWEIVSYFLFSLLKLKLTGYCVCICVCLAERELKLIAMWICTYVLWNFSWLNRHITNISWNGASVMMMEWNCCLTADVIDFSNIGQFSLACNLFLNGSHRICVSFLLVNTILNFSTGICTQADHLYSMAFNTFAFTWLFSFFLIPVEARWKEFNLLFVK